IDPVISFLQGKNDAAAYKINSGKWLPEGERQEYDQQAGIEFSDDSVIDRARHKATLYLEEIGDIISCYCDESFGFSRYAERIALSPPEFTRIKETISGELSFTARSFTKILENEISDFNPVLCGFSVPFPGNLTGALICADYIKKRRNSIKTVIGGGYINTELRTIKDPDFFNYFDYMTLDDGELPLIKLTEYINGKCTVDHLKRTFLIDKKSGSLRFADSKDICDYSVKELPAPDYEGLFEAGYLSLLPVTNRMHRLWSEGKWNKMTLAHGCYWHRCAFCDTSLDYIKRYETQSASVVVDKIEKIIEQTGNYSFHFVDEAAPPALLKNMAVELIKRGISINWWTNIRFEKSFKRDLCRLLQKSGCIAVSGGLEVASDRLLESIDKGVTVEQVSSVAAAFGSAGIMVHTYLMYGFPGQQEKEIIDAVETVRQLFSEGLVDSAFWHQFALTAHSPVGLNPELFRVNITGPAPGSFARNDLIFESDMNYDPDIYSSGLKNSLASYMTGRDLQRPVGSWFNFRTPKTSVKKNFIRNIISKTQNSLVINNASQFLWTGADLSYNGEEIVLYDTDGAEKIKASISEWKFLSELTKICNIKEGKRITTVDIEKVCADYSTDLDYWLSSDLFSILSS
ncbi:MAG: radical SAM protein, partial [Proteobacteria bacterium]|nr:radical SAM protein [Pseudomonadota bacterium]